MNRSSFGSETRATDGCIVTFELPDGSIHVERFSQLVHTLGQLYQRVRRREGDPYMQQAAARADELGAKILCISTPQTILTDLQGTRAALEPKATGVDGPRGGVQLNPPQSVRYPEMDMLGKIKRTDLYKRPTNGQTDGSIRQVKQRKPSHTGLRGD